MTYMPLRVLTLELKHRDSPKLAEILTKWMWTRNMTYRFLLMPRFVSVYSRIFMFIGIFLH